jgi:hypothetical protein
VIASGRHPGDRQRLRDLPAALAAERALVGPVDEARQLCSRGGRVTVERARRAVGAVPQERPECPLEAGHLTGRHLRRVERRVELPVQDEPAHPLREPLGVARAEVGAVGLAEIAQPPVAESGAQHVQVAHRLDSADVGGDCGLARDASAPEPAPLRLQRLLLRRGVR